jgi:hypothetical protein
MDQSADLVGNQEPSALSMNSQPVAPPSDAVAEAPLDYMAEAPSDVTAEAIPDAAAETSPDIAAEAMPDAAAETSPDTAAEAMPDAAAETSPDTTTEAPSDAAAETSPDTATEAPSDAAVEAPSEVTVVNETIEVQPGETFDGNNQTYTAGSALGDGGQGEDQKPIFKLGEGATLQNVVIGENGADGVHVYGDATIDNVHWTDVGEDALTVKESGADGIADVTITNSSARNADDKIFQLNADSNLTIDNFEAEDFGKLVRTNGGQQGNFEINLNDITATNGKEALVRSDAEGIVVNAGNINTENVKQDWMLPDSATVNQS